MLADRLASTVRKTRSNDILNGSPSRVVFSQIGSASPPVRGISNLAEKSTTPVKTPTKTPDAMAERRRLSRTLSFTPTKATNTRVLEAPKPFTSFESVDSGVVLTPRRSKPNPDTTPSKGVPATTPSKRVHFTRTPQKVTTTPMKSILRTRSTNLFGSPEKVVPDLPAVQRVDLGPETLSLSPVKVKSPQKENLARFPTFDDLIPFQVDIDMILEQDEDKSVAKNMNDALDLSKPDVETPRVKIGECSTSVADLPSSSDAYTKLSPPRNLWSSETLPVLTREMSEDMLSLRSSIAAPVLSPQVVKSFFEDTQTVEDSLPLCSVAQSRNRGLKRKSDELEAIGRRTPKKKSPAKCGSSSIRSFVRRESSQDFRCESPISMRIKRIGRTHSATLSLEGEIVARAEMDFASPSQKGSPRVHSERKRRYKPMQLTTPGATSALDSLLMSPIVTPAKGKPTRLSQSEPKAMKQPSRESDGFSIEEWDVPSEALPDACVLEEEDVKLSNRRPRGTAREAGLNKVRRSLCRTATTSLNVIEEVLPVGEVENRVDGVEPSTVRKTRSKTRTTDMSVERKMSELFGVDEESGGFDMLNENNFSLRARHVSNADSGISGGKTPTGGVAARRSKTPVEECEGYQLRSSSRTSGAKTPTRSRQDSISDNNQRSSSRASAGKRSHDDCDARTSKRTPTRKCNTPIRKENVESGSSRPKRSASSGVQYTYGDSDGDDYESKKK